MVPVALMYCRTPSGSFGAHGSSLPGNADRGRCVLVLFASLVALLPGGCSSAMPSEPALCAAGCTHDDAEVSPLAVGEDVDRDGLRDDEEAAIALRFAPIVTLHAADWTRPASVAWVGLRGGAFGSKPWDGAHGQAKSGSADPADWVTYVHVCPAGYGGVIVQYWFFYPYNDGPPMVQPRSGLGACDRGAGRGESAVGNVGGAAWGQCSWGLAGLGPASQGPGYAPGGTVREGKPRLVLRSTGRSLGGRSRTLRESGAWVRSHALAHLGGRRAEESRRTARSSRPRDHGPRGAVGSVRTSARHKRSPRTRIPAWVVRRRFAVLLAQAPFPRTRHRDRCGFDRSPLICLGAWQPWLDVASRSGMTALWTLPELSS